MCTELYSLCTYELNDLRSVIGGKPFQWCGILQLFLESGYISQLTTLQADIIRHGSMTSVVLVTQETDTTWMVDGICS